VCAHFGDYDVESVQSSSTFRYLRRREPTLRRQIGAHAAGVESSSLWGCQAFTAAQWRNVQRIPQPPIGFLKHNTSHGMRK
jgi:hypothetical protein